MEHIIDQQLIADVATAVSAPARREGVDTKLGGLAVARTSLGEQAVEVVLLGLSRVVALNVEDVGGLIDEWERRDLACCFDGDVDELMGLKDTVVLAVSYKHDVMSRWNRKGDGRISKMNERDQHDLTQALVGLGDYVNTKQAVIWCDQVLSTRLKDRCHSYGWYNAGLLPYICLPVLKLSEHVPEEELEKRIWIRAERSLGRMSQGVLSASDARIALSSSLGQMGPMGAVKMLALLILSGYWPDDRGHWKKDYHEMKWWAMGLLCRPARILEPPLFEEIRPVDNLDILAALAELVLIPKAVFEDRGAVWNRVVFEEAPVYTKDRWFYLKVTAWNLYLEDVWNRDGKNISHYMGKMECRFSWWSEQTSGNVFGCIVAAQTGRGTCVLGIKEGCGYKVFREDVNPLSYRHKERTASNGTKQMILDVAQKRNVDANEQGEWRLLYCSDSNMEVNWTDDHVKAAMGECDTYVDALVPFRFVGATTCVFRAALAKLADDERAEELAKLFVHLFERWNTHVRGTYHQWISVRDTFSGPVWLEGYNEEAVSFGFLDFLTRNLICPSEQCYLSSQTIALPTKWETVGEIRRAMEACTDDTKAIGEELTKGITEQNCEATVATADVARAMVSGAFSSGFGNDRVSSFLVTWAERRGYWSTDVRCRDGKLQVVFINSRGDVRIMQRSTPLADFMARGLVCPQDYDMVKDVSDLVTEDGEQYRAYNFWRSGMADTLSRLELQKRFRNSCKDIGNGRTLCLIDMTASIDMESDCGTVHDPSGQNGAFVSKEEREAQQMEQLLSLLPEEFRTAFIQKAAQRSTDNEAVPQREESFESKLVRTRGQVDNGEETWELANKSVQEHIRVSRQMKEDKARRDARRVHAASSSTSSTAEEPSVD